MGMTSKRKGKTGEREAAAALHDVLGIEARRGVQYSGSPDSPDVIGWPGVHIEVKRVERFNAYEAMTQAVNDAEQNMPLVLHRRNRGEWLAVIRLADLPGLVPLMPPPTYPLGT